MIHAVERSKASGPAPDYFVMRDFDQPGLTYLAALLAVAGRCFGGLGCHFPKVEKRGTFALPEVGPQAVLRWQPRNPAGLEQFGWRCSLSCYSIDFRSEELLSAV